MVVLGVLSVSALGCSGEAADSPPAAPGQPERFMFAPEPDIAAYAEAMVTRWSDATGLPLRIDPLGTPVLYGDPVGADGKPTCGATTVSRGQISGAFLWADSIVVARGKRDGCGYSSDSLIHEGPHAFAPDAEHSHGGVFARVWQGTTKIDVESILVVCANAPCRWVQPE